MNKYSEFEEDDIVEKRIDLIGIINKYLSYWKWFLFSLIVCFTVAALYLKFTLPSYEITTSILLKDDQKGGGTVELSVFKEMGLLTQKNNVDNELEMLNKAAIAEQVVHELGIYANYTRIATFQLVKSLQLNDYFPGFGEYKDKILYGDECPILVRLSNEALDNLSKSIEFKVLVHPYGVYEFSGTYMKKRYSTKASISDNNVILPFGKVFFSRGKLHPTEDMLIAVTIVNPASMAEQIMNSLKMDLTSKTTSVVNISLKSSNVQLGKAILSKFIEVYNRNDLNDQIALANKSAQFIDDRLMLLTKELGSVETQVENYKQSEGITDIKSQSDVFIQQTNDFAQKRLQLETQIAIVSDLNDYLQKKENRYQIIPSNSGIESQGLNELISNYNKLILQRNKFSRIASSSNQAMIDLTSQIESMFSTVQSSVQNEKDNLKIAERDLLRKNGENLARIRAIPRQERQYTEIKRQQGVKEALFLFLLQKKEEKYMNLSLVEPVSKFIDKVRSSGHPVSPQKMLILIVSLIIGTIIPIIGIKIRDLLRYKIENKKELEEMTIVPVLGEIPQTDQKGNIIIEENNTDSFNELVRLLRTNLLFVMESSDKKVINVVSSVGGEGKTFVTVNLAISLALLDKKVLVIGLDIRKPKLAEYLRMDNKTGITMYLTGHIDKTHLILSSGVHPNLSVILPGPIPPNPNELLSKRTLDHLIGELKNQFDYILIDTAPIALVSDSFTLNRFADVNLYVVRADFTPKRGVEDATNLYKQKKLNNLYFVLNGTNKSKINYSYGLGKKSGYGYGYTKGK